MKVNDGVLMSNEMSHRTGRDDKDDLSHDGRESGPMRGRTCLDGS